MSASSPQAARPARNGLLDALRGLTLLSMMLYHATWNLVYLYDIPLPWYPALPGTVWQKSICCTFILLSGFCWSLGKRHLRRGLTVFLAGGLVSAATILFMPEAAIYFGILTFLGSAMLLLIPLHPALKRCPPVLGLGLSLLLFFLFFPVSEGYLGFGDTQLLSLPAALYQGQLGAFLGFTPRGFRSSDYFSLLPWFFLFLAGYFLFPLLKNRLDRISFSGQYSAPLRFIGRHSLLLYLLHQPVIFGVMTLVFS